MTQHPQTHPQLEPDVDPLRPIALRLLVGVLAFIPALMFVVGLATLHWRVALAAVPMAGFFGAAGRASWVRAEAQVATIDARFADARHLYRNAAMWAVAALTCIALAVVVISAG